MEAHASESLYTNARGDFEGYVQGWSHLARSPIARPRPLLSALPPQGKQEAGERAGEGARGLGGRARADGRRNRRRVAGEGARARAVQVRHHRARTARRRRAEHM